MQIQFSRPTLSTEEWDRKRSAWVDVVEDHIPPNRLADVFKRAIRNHTDSFPLAVSELIPAWNSLHEEERQAAVEQASLRRSCETCVEAQKQQVPCPFHQRNYKIFPQQS